MSSRKRRRVQVKRFGLFLAFVLLSATILPVMGFGDNSKTETGIIFGRGDDVDLKLDIAVPGTGSGPFPALIYIFGGGWGYYSGSRSQCPIQLAAAEGYVAATVDYRLTNVKENGKTKYLFPAQLYDVKAAVRWMRANASRYNIDPDRIGIVGWSSGAHLALLLGLTSPADGLEGNSGNAGYSSRVQAVVAMAGMVEAVSFYKTTNVPARVAALLGGSPEEVPDQYVKASPLTYESKDDPPVLFIQGDADTSCPLAQAELLQKNAASVGASFVLLVKKGVGHQDFYGDPEVWSFLDRNLASSAR
jgi:acetyl esterase/lipase